ncbi:hypothetical protein T265_03987 [Opisthorchis viverrini]|uniref:Uncharacterized protein n=1 Tax=Opisthorchis viverrini TaxID=6198 RepID=A0A074ZQL0_OPIVI|nr:hypothetical protein T265_03987 [Opisthorchis viverrini]KER29421.1 hypothetical protein T265_03987 [Opisthorchis viverrini]
MFDEECEAKTSPEINGGKQVKDFRFFSDFGPESSLLVSLPLFSLAESEDSVPDEALSSSLSLCDDEDPFEAKVSVSEESDDSVEL